MKMKMISKTIYFVGLCLIMVAFTDGDVFVEEVGETETISIDEPIHDEKSFDETTFDKKSSVDEILSRSKRASDYSSEAYEDEEESAAAGSGSEATYEDEVRFRKTFQVWTELLGLSRYPTRH